MELINKFKNSKNKHKYEFLWIITSILLIPISYFIFYIVIGSKMHFAIIIFGVGTAKLIISIIGEIFEPNFGDKRFTPFLMFLSYTSMLFVMFVLVFILIIDSKNTNSKALKIIENQQIKTK